MNSTNDSTQPINPVKQFKIELNIAYKIKLYEKYHNAGFSLSLVLIFLPTFIVAIFGTLLNFSMVFVTVKCR